MKYRTHTYKGEPVSLMPTFHLLAAYRKGMTLLTLDEETAAAMRLELQEHRRVSPEVIIAPLSLTGPQAIGWARDVFPGATVTTSVYGGKKVIGARIASVLYGGKGETWLEALNDLMDRAGRMPQTGGAK